MPYFARRIQLDKHLGPEFRFEAAEFGEERPTMTEAIEAVENDIEIYVRDKKDEIKRRKLNEAPF